MKLERFRWFRILLIASILPLVPPLGAQPPMEARRQAGYPPRFHDPSTPIKEGNQWWIFATGNGISVRKSRDLKEWTESAPVLKVYPKWHKEIVPDHKGHLWAPDVVKHDGIYRLYYSVSSFGKNTSAIGLLTSPALDPSDPRCKWEDRGIVIRSNEKDPFNAIDPAVFVDGDGKHWMSFGSFWTGIQLIELEPKTGLAHPSRKEVRRIAWHESIEAPAIHKHGKYYYLFVNWGLCCRGVDSTYEIRVGRSKSVTGPYLDKDGNDLATGGGSLLLATKGDQIGPGHASFVTEKIDPLMFYHFYDRSRRGFATLGRRTLSWDKNGWPALGD